MLSGGQDDGPAPGVLHLADDIVTPPFEQAELEWRLRSLLDDRSPSIGSDRYETDSSPFKRAIESTGHAVFITDVDGTIEYVNPAFEEVTGFAREEAIGRTPNILNSGEMSDGYFAELWDTILSGDVWHEEVVNQHKAGEIYVAEQTIAPISDGENLSGFVAMQHDITDHKRREEEIQRVKKRFQMLFEKAPEEIVVHDSDGNILDANKRILENTGYSRESLTSMGVTDFEVGVSREEATDIWTEMNVGETRKIERTRERTDGSTYPVEMWTNKVVLGGKIRFLSFGRDITDRKERETELQVKTRAIENAPVGIVISDATQEDNPIIYANDRVTEITGYSKEELAGSGWQRLQGEHTDSAALAKIRDGIDDQQSVAADVKTYRKDGTEFWSRLELAPVENDAGDVVNWIGFHKDITMHKEREQQLETLDRVLRHNLRNSMNVIQARAEKIQYEASGELARSAENIVDASQKLSGTTEKIRKITDLLRENPEPESVQIEPLLQQVVSRIGSEYPDATITVDCPADVTVQTTEPFDAVLIELVTNAVIHSDAATPEVDITVTQSECRSRIEITDSGPLIPEMERDILVRNEERTPLYHGSGLGLWLVKIMVSRSGGTITFDEADSGGNIVGIELPH